MSNGNLYAIAAFRRKRDDVIRVHIHISFSNGIIEL